MAYEVPIGGQAEISFSAGEPEDYTFTSTDPEKGTVNSEGIFSAVAEGLVVIIVTRISDDAQVGTVLVRVVGEAIVDAPDVEIGPLSAVLTIDTDTPGMFFFSWDRVDTTTELEGESATELRLTGFSDVLLQQTPLTESGMFPLYSPGTEVDAEFHIRAALDDQTLGPIQASAIASQSPGEPFTNISVANHFMGHTVLVTFTLEGTGYRTFYIRMTDGNVYSSESAAEYSPGQRTVSVQMGMLPPGNYYPVFRFLSASNPIQTEDILGVGVAPFTYDG